MPRVWVRQAEVDRRAGRLTISMGPADDPDVYPLTHRDRDTFTYEPVGENANVRAAVTFAIGPDGVASAVTVENLDLQRQGTFTLDEET